MKNKSSIALPWLLMVLFCVLFWMAIRSLCFADWIPKDNWTLVFVDSEQIAAYDERAVNAFDGNPNTHWFSVWSPSPEPLPHEIQIDLGASYMLDGFSYLPRQSTNLNGQIKQYAFYVTDTISEGWGDPVSSGEFGTGIQEKMINFVAAKTGRFIRLVALSELSGHPAYTSVAEIGVRSFEAAHQVPAGSGFKVTFDPSPDERATGHKLYVADTITGPIAVYDLQSEVIREFQPGELPPGITYRLTATAYGNVDGKPAESVHSEPLYVKLLEAIEEPEDPEEPVLKKPGAPIILDIVWRLTHSR